MQSATRLSRIAGLLALLLFTGNLLAQSLATVQGQVTDPTGAAVPGAAITVTNTGTGLSQTTKSDSTGNYQVPALPLGNYDVTVQSSGLEKQVAKGLVLEVGRITVQNFQLKVAQANEVITVAGEVPIIESATITVGQTIEQKTVQEIPLNGRHFVDLALLTPGTVVPPANGFLTAPLRGQGAFGIVSAGNREDATNFMINGVNLNDMANGQVTFQPSIDTVSEFTINNQTPSAEYGRNSGEVVNIATRSGTNDFHGEGFDFLRNNDLDARNFFNKVGTPMGPFKRNDFGGDIGGPIWKGHTFFFGSYEGLRQRQAVQLGSSVPSAAQRAAVTDPNIQKLLALVPTGTGGDANNPASFQGGASAPVNIDQGTGDISHNFSDKDRIHGYYVFQRDQRKEPNLSGATVPGGGDTRQSHRQLFTLSETHVFSPALVNDFRAGFNRIRINFITDVQNAGLDPTAFGIQDGLSGPVGIPQLFIGQAANPQLEFGGERNFPQGRGDLTAIASDTLSYLRGNHSLKFGGEYRRFIGNSILGDEGQIGYASFAAFLANQPNSFVVNLGGNHPSRVSQPAMGLFAMDSYKIRSYLTLELGLRWEWNFTPTEADNRSSVFLPAQSWLVQLGTNGVNQEYHQNNKLFQPRVGFSWDVFHNGKTVLRSGYGILYDEPLPIISSNNPPFGLPVSFTSSTAKPTTSFSTLLTDAAGSGLAPATTNPNYNDAYIQSYNLNVQQQITPTTGLMIGYFGSKGTHLNMQVNLNQLQPTGTPGVYARPFPALAPNSPIIPVTPNGTKLTALSNITDNESIGTSNYNALWITGTKRVSRGLQFDANYTWSKSLDENSRNFETIALGPQDAFHPFADYGPSDFDARNHFTFSGVYDLPFSRNRLVSGWRLGTIAQLQSGNPLNITAGGPFNSVKTTSNPNPGAAITGFTGVNNIRPDLTGPLPPVGASIIMTGSNAGNIQYFSASICDPTQPSSCTGAQTFSIPVSVVGGRNVFHFGNIGRNAIVGPGFEDLDFSLSKTTKITERLSHEFRIEAFDLFNHPNFGNPVTQATAGSTTFGVIRATRNPTGDAGSSRQLQIAMKLIF
jgi:hypothetical protein